MLFPDTKFYPQSLPSDLVKRSDLLNTLNEHLDKSLITIVAPSGYGKSVLISNWLDSFDITAAWISLDEYDNNFSTFLRSLISSLDKAFLGKLEFLKTFLSSRKLPTIKVLSNTLINELNKLEKSFLLVLDDFQTVSEPSVHSFIIQILENCPKSMRIVICSRNKMPFPLENYYKYNKILEIKSHDLKFNLSETSEFIRNSSKQDIDEYIIIKIHEITEGWVTALRLMILHLNQINALNDPEKELYDNNYLTDHLFEEIISSEFVKYKSLLFVSAIPNRFCKDLCNELFYVINDYQPDRSSTRELISKLSEENLFLINLDNKNTWYRYHYLFRKFLIKNGEVSLGIEKLAKVNLAACNWFAAQGLLNEALQHALAANDQQTAATIIEDHYLEKLQREEWFTIGNWLSTLGDSVINQRPNLLLAQCWTNYFQFRFNELDENTCLAEKLLQGKSTTKLQKGQLELFKGIMCYWHD